MAEWKIERVLISWEELQERKQKQLQDRHQRSGVRCPKCETELMVDVMCVLATNPPQRLYHCEKCGWHGTA